MGSWILFLVSALVLCFLLMKHFTPTTKNKKIDNLPPGPPTILVLAKFLLHYRSISDFNEILRDFHARYGPIFTLRTPSKPVIFIADGRFAHEAFVQKGAGLSDRLPPVDPLCLLTSNGNIVSLSPYGPQWRLLRRNLVSGILHPSHTKQFAPVREWVLQGLMERLREQAKAAGGVVVPEKIFKFSLLRLFVVMCFGEKPDDGVISRLDEANEILHDILTRFNVFQFFPIIAKNILFRKRWNQIVSNRKMLDDICAELLRARQEKKMQNVSYAYVDSLLELELPDESGRKLSWDETASLCQELIGAGPYTSMAVLQWIMANIVKRPDIQLKLVDEIKGVMAGRGAKELVEKEDLQKMTYLKAVVMEGIRRHPAAYIGMPHAASEDTQVGKYTIPKKSMVILIPPEINLDAEVWEEPMEFKPERFLKGGEGDDGDLTGSREVKIVTFGTGRRICPGMDLAVMTIEYLVANLVREFEWKVVEGEQIDMGETMGLLAVVMAKPLRAQILPRIN